MTRFLLVAVFLAASGLLTSASAGWSGYWTYESPPGTWLWTWVWYAPSSGFTTSSQHRAAMADGLGADCCGIEVDNFASLGATETAFTGLLASDFTVKQGASSGDLGLELTGNTPISANTYLGTMTLSGPGLSPDTTTGVDLAFNESFLGPDGGRLSATGSIRSSVPEPATALLMLAPLAYLARRRRAPKVARQPLVIGDASAICGEG